MDKSLLKKLAPELRNVIYEMVLQSSMDLYLYSQTQVTIGDDIQRSVKCVIKPRSKEIAEAARQSLALTRVCRELRSETVAMFYATNRFVFNLAPSSGAGAGSWGKATKLDYAAGLGSVRGWLQLLPAAAARNIKVHISFGYVDASGEPHNVKANRAILWWKETRKLESSILYPVMDAANLLAVFRVQRGSQHFVTCSKHPGPFFGEKDCQWTVFKPGNLVLDIPTSDRAAARLEVEKVLCDFSDKVEQAIAVGTCGLEKWMRRRLQQDADAVRMLVAEPETKPRSSKGKGKARA